jgi:transglutaminase-like putative cysteine protease
VKGFQRSSAERRVVPGRLTGYLAGLLAAAALIGLALTLPSSLEFSRWVEGIGTGGFFSEAPGFWLSGFLLSGLGAVLAGVLEGRGRLGGIRGWRLTAFSLLISLAPPLGIYVFFEARGPLALLVGLTLAVNLLSFSISAGPGGFGARLLRALLYGGSALLIFSGLIVTPVSAYIAWFEILKGSGTGGLIPFVFSMTAGFFTAAFGTAVYRGFRLPPALGSLAVSSMVISVILQSPWLGALALAAGSAALVLLFRGGKEGSYSPLTALAVAMLLAVPAAGLTKADGNLFIDDFLSPWIRKQVVRLLPEFPFLYTMPGYGYTLNEKRLGAAPALSRRALFRVRGRPGEILYLRTRVFDFYTGQGWELSGEVKKLAGMEAGSWFRSGEEGDALEIEVLIDFINTLPHTLDMIHFRTDREYETQLAGLETGFLLKDPILRGETFIVQRGKKRVDSADLLPYTAVPSSLPAEVRRLAERLGSAEKDEQILDSISRYLAQNNSYSLESGAARAGVDSTWDFLFNSRTGYCSNFATAYVILARLNGIPARYATGFLVFLPFDDGQTFVTGYASHAWPEVWLPDRGWTSREATPPMNPDYMEGFRRFGGPGGGMDDTTRGQLEGMLGERAPWSGDEADRGNGAGSFLFLLPLLAGLAAAAALLVLRRRLAAQLPGKGPRRQAERELRSILRILKQPESQSPVRAGWLRWAEETSRGRESGETALIRRVSRIALKGFFGPRPPARRDLEYLRLSAKRLRRSQGSFLSRLIKKS